MKLFLLLLLVPMFVFSVERGQGVSNKEVIESLVKLEEGQKAILQRFDYIDKRFEDINRRFEDLNKQLDRITAIFTALVVAVIGFAYWDRRTIIKKAKV